MFLAQWSSAKIPPWMDGWVDDQGLRLYLHPCKDETQYHLNSALLERDAGDINISAGLDASLLLGVISQ